ncbi:MAG: aminotransferase class I/II-fold pyridoxal phosphate-dependent enzyme, partial [Clostridium celatum]|nr:aminotransferase class I/II-fold pyridoxal phosphate-dependent enzyme [Clostridium celatum]
MELSRKAQRIEASVTLAITAKAKEMKEKGIDVISFGAGEPDFNTPENIINAAIKAMQEGNTKYTNVNGILPLREAICKKFKEDNGLIYKPSQIVVSTGAKQSLANVFLAILN